MRRFFCLFAIVTTVLCSDPGMSAANDDQIPPSKLDFFEKKIRPALNKYCYSCHSLESGTTRGGLLLDTRDGLLIGGDSGPAVTPGKPAESLLLEAINWESLEMPPSEKMPASVIADFQAWIEMGAPDPRERKRMLFTTKISADDINDGKQHWAFQPPRKPEETNLDRLIAARLKSTGLQPVGPADAQTLLRRLSFDLIGLPPTPDEVQTFLADSRKNREQAIIEKVDELLARPQFGERWGRHWLDVARYADTSGVINVGFPQAWRYRNYVIDCFNEDTPYDQFIREQIAGDLLKVTSDEEWQKNLIATGFLAIGIKRLNERNPRKFQMDMIDEQIDTVTQSILGITVACARCHDHKYDPIPTTDYYSLAGIFLSTKTLYGTVWGQQNHRPSNLLLLPVQDEDPAETGQSTEAIEKQLADLRAELRAMNVKARQSGERVQRDFVSIRNRISRLEGILSTLNPDGTRKTLGMGVQDHNKPVNASVLIGGDVERPAQAVPRGFLQVLNEVPGASIPADSSGRRELADWMTSRSNPLTARVMVNRIWAHLFGAPIVTTPNNWGLQAANPTHPDVLDLLSVRFMEENWSIKSLIRRIVLSDSYQRSSEYHAANAEIDPDNEMLWRSSPRQIDAECLRDAMLSSAGSLNLERPIVQPGNWSDSRVNRGPGSQLRLNPQNDYRSVYLPVFRDSVHESLDLFGFADPNLPSEGRRESIVPSQALYLLNGEFALRQASAMASRMLLHSPSRSEQVHWAFLTAFGRVAKPNELKSSLRFIASIDPATIRELDSTRTDTNPRRRPRTFNGSGQSGRPRRIPFRSSPGQSRVPQTDEQRVLTLFCQALMASAEFRIVD